VPASLAPELGNDVLHNPSAKDFQLLFRLAPGITVDAAEAALDGVTRRLDKDDPSRRRSRIRRSGSFCFPQAPACRSA